MAISERQLKRELRKLGPIFQAAWTRKHPLTDEERAVVRKAAREAWERDHPSGTPSEVPPEHPQGQTMGSPSTRQRKKVARLGGETREAAADTTVEEHILETDLPQVGSWTSSGIAAEPVLPPEPPVKKPRKKRGHQGS